MKKAHLFAHCLHFVHIMRAYTRAIFPRLHKNRSACNKREDIPCFFALETDFCQSSLQNGEKRRKTRRKGQVKSTAKQQHKKRILACFGLQKHAFFAQRVFKKGVLACFKAREKRPRRMDFGAASRVAFSFSSLCILSILPFCFLNDVTNT